MPPPAVQVSNSVQALAWRQKTLPQVESRLAGLWCVPVPIPDSPLMYSLIYVLRSPDGLVLVDAGWDSNTGWFALQEGLNCLGGSIKDIRKILITHGHADHHGLSERIREASGAWVGMHRREAESLPRRHPEANSHRKSLERFLHRAGVPDEEMESVCGDAEHHKRLNALIEPDGFIEDDEEFALGDWTLRAIWTPGHTPGHLCFFESQHRLLMSGDHLLPSITPNISLRPDQDENPYLLRHSCARGVVWPFGGSPDVLRARPIVLPCPR